MIVAMDVNFCRAQRAGIGSYAINLLRSLEKADANNRYLLYTFFSKKRGFEIDKSGLPVQANFHLKTVPLPFRLARFLLRTWSVPIECMIGSCDVLHGLAFSAPKTKRAKLVITVHDLAFLLFSEQGFSNPQFMKYEAPYFADCARRADRIIAVSENTKKDIVRLLSIREDKVTVVYEAADPIFKPIDNREILEHVQFKYKLPLNFILHVGTIEPRKNIVSLLNAYKLFKTQKKGDHKLVLVGKDGWSYETVYSTITGLHLEDDVMSLGYLPEDDLPALYNLADVLVYPSKYEGFGLPALEALACGTPVIASNKSCFPEILGDAAVLVDSDDCNDLAECMHSVISGASSRVVMRQRGFERAKLFSWERAAKETLEIYEGLC